MGFYVWENKSHLLIIQMCGTQGTQLWPTEIFGKICHSCPKGKDQLFVLSMNIFRFKISLHIHLSVKCVFHFRFFPWVQNMQCIFLCLNFNHFLEWIFRFRFNIVQVIRNSQIFTVNSDLICPIIFYTIFPLCKKEFGKHWRFVFFHQVMKEIEPFCFYNYPNW